MPQLRQPEIARSILSGKSGLNRVEDPQRAAKKKESRPSRLHHRDVKATIWAGLEARIAAEDAVETPALCFRPWPSILRDEFAGEALALLQAELPCEARA